MFLSTDIAPLKAYLHKTDGTYSIYGILNDCVLNVFFLVCMMHQQSASTDSDSSDSHTATVIRRVCLVTMETDLPTCDLSGFLVFSARLS